MSSRASWVSTKVLSSRPSRDRDRGPPRGLSTSIVVSLIRISCPGSSGTLPFPLIGCPSSSVPLALPRSSIQYRPSATEMRACGRDTRRSGLKSISTCTPAGPAEHDRFHRSVRRSFHCRGSDSGCARRAFRLLPVTSSTLSPTPWGGLVHPLPQCAERSSEARPLPLPPAVRRGCPSAEAGAPPPRGHRGSPTKLFCSAARRCSASGGSGPFSIERAAYSRWSNVE